MTGSQEPTNDDADGMALEESHDSTELLRACWVALRLSSTSERYQPRHLPFWSVSDADRRISQLLPQLPGGTSLEMFLPGAAGQGAARGLHHRAALAATLVTSLELARSGTLAREQAEIWSPIMVS